MATEDLTKWFGWGPNPIPGCPVLGSHIWGWMTAPELAWLHARASEMDSVVEVGSLRGRSAFALLSGCDGPVWCIDPWDDEYGQALPAFMEACGHFPNLHPIQGFSPAAAEQVPDVDMVFLDGDHSYETVVAELEAWVPKTRKLICGHDYSNMHYEGVKQAVDERFGGRVTVPRDCSIWAVEL